MFKSFGASHVTDVRDIFLNGASDSEDSETFEHDNSY